MASLKSGFENNYLSEYTPLQILLEIFIFIRLRIL